EPPRGKTLTPLRAAPRVRVLRVGPCRAFRRGQGRRRVPGGGSRRNPAAPLLAVRPPVSGAVQAQLDGSPGDGPPVRVGPQRRPLVLLPRRVEHRTRACGRLTLDGPLLVQYRQRRRLAPAPGTHGDRQPLPAAPRPLGEPG